MGAVLALGGMVPLEVAPQLSVLVRDLQVSGRHFRMTILRTCGSTSARTIFSPSDSCLRRYWEVQVEVGEAVQGWIYWTWKVRSLWVIQGSCRTSSNIIPWQTESADEWSYQMGLEGGWIPQDPTER